MTNDYLYREVHWETVELFLRGIKPSILVPKHELYSLLELKTFPFVDINGQRLYFQNELKKLSFLEDGGCTHEKVGRALGFPPNAIDSYINKPPLEIRVHVNYYGIVFITNKYVLHEDLLWLINTYDIPEDIKIDHNFYVNSLYVEDIRIYKN